ncbi:MAG TPA: sugar ABC transporter substrate-binding protein, partial [Beutenbergiaceae bacterium]|nr:sugar ABC transporter substrate-binding protein [Beutenbergiaceae bacterium]
AGEVELNFVATFPEEAVAPTVEAWNEENPDVKVSYDPMPFNDLNEVIRARVGSGDATPDVYAADQPRMSALVDGDLLLDVSEDFPDADDLFDPSTVEASTVDGKLYAAPVNTSMVVLYYNKDLLDEAGLDFPSKNPDERMTWEELRDNAEQAQDSGAEWGFELFRVSQYFQMQPLPESKGGGNGLEIDGDDVQPDLLTDGWIDSMQFFQDLHEDGIAPRGVAVEEVPELFASGQLAYFLGTTAHHDEWAYDLDEVDYGIAPHPYFEGGEEVTPTGAWSLGINPSSQYQDEAREFIRFVTATAEGSEAWADGVGNIPANVETQGVYFEKDIYSGDEQDDFSTAELIDYELNNTARNRPRIVNYIEFETIMGDAFEDIRNGQSVEDTLQNAQDQLAAGGSGGRS